jgi:hypothetical protein
VKFRCPAGFSSPLSPAKIDLKRCVPAGPEINPDQTKSSQKNSKAFKKMPQPEV